MTFSVSSSFFVDSNKNYLIEKSDHQYGALDVGGGVSNIFQRHMVTMGGYECWQHPASNKSQKKSVCDPEHSDDHQVDNNANTPSSCRRWLSHGHSDNKEGANITNNAKSSDAGEAIGSHHHPADGWSKAADCRVHRHVQAKHRAGVLLKVVK